MATAESPAVSVMQEPGDIWECRVTEGVATEGGKAEAMGGWVGKGRRGCRFPGKRGRPSGEMRPVRLKVEAEEHGAPSGRLRM